MASDEHPRPDRSQEEDDYRDGPRKKGNPTLVIVLALVGLGVVAVVVLGVVGLLLWSDPRPMPAPAPPVASEPGPDQGTTRVWGRDELKASLVGKTPDQVTELLGPPRRTMDNNDGELIWVYRVLTRNPVSGGEDGFTYVIFKDGKVASFRY